MLARRFIARLGAPAAVPRSVAPSRAFAAGERHPAFKYYGGGQPPDWVPVKYVLLNRYEVLSDRWRKYKLWIGGVAFIGGCLFAWDTYRSRQPAVVANNLVAAFEKGYVPDEEEKKDKGATLPRPALHLQLQQLLRPKESDSYALVVGAHGTGKVRCCGQAC